MKGGKGYRRPDKDFDPKQLKIGTRIEMEHTNNKRLAKQIAKDHLIEHPQYYTHLIKMEKKLEKPKKRRK